MPSGSARSWWSGYATIAAQMALYGTGMGLTSAPATDAIMGVVPKAKAGVGSAVNDATRLLGGTLGVAVIGSLDASLYTSRLAAALPPRLPTALAGTARSSAGAALAIADQLTHAAHPALGAAVHAAAADAFIHGLSVACLASGAIAGAGVVIALALLPAQPAAPQIGPSGEPPPIDLISNPAEPRATDAMLVAMRSGPIPSGARDA